MVEPKSASLWANSVCGGAGHYTKPWWTKELTRAYAELRSAREVLRGWMREFHCPSLFLAEQVSQKRRNTIKLVQKMKQEYYQKITTEANAQNVWNLRDWTRPKRTVASPPMHMGDNLPPAISHEEKCQVLCKHLFLDPPNLPKEPPINLTPNPV